MFNIVLINPQIPGNTGTIGRLAINTDSKLHLIKPLGFNIDDKAVKRAGLDYWHKLNPTIWNNFDEFLKNNIKYSDKFFFATTKTDKKYFDVNFPKDSFLFFGSETEGISKDILLNFKEQNITIPMGKHGRSLNLAISVGIILYKAIEQNFDNFNMG